MQRILNRFSNYCKRFSYFIMNGSKGRLFGLK